MIVAGSLGSCTRPGEHLGRHAVKLCVHGVGDASQRTHKEAVAVGGQAAHCDGLGSGGGGGGGGGGGRGGGRGLLASTEAHEKDRLTALPETCMSW